MLYFVYQTDTFALVDSEEDGDCYFEVKVPLDVAQQITRGIFLAINGEVLAPDLAIAPYSEPLE